MTEHDRACPLDGAHLPPDRTVCRTCTGTLRGLLTDLPGLMGDLVVTLTRQARYGPRVGARTTTNPLPFAYGASEARWVAHTTLVGWTFWVADIRAHRRPETWGEIAGYLRDHGGLDWAAQHPDGPQLVEELTAALRNARRAIDRPADRAFIGTCGALIEIDVVVDGHRTLLPASCPEELYAPVDRDEIDCPRCGTTWNVRARQDAMLTDLRDVLLPAVDVARAVDGLGVDITPERIRQWKRRGVLAPAVDECGRARADVHGRPLYRVGDVLDVVAGQAVSDPRGSVSA